MVLNHFAYGRNYVDHVFGMAFVLRGCPVCCRYGARGCAADRKTAGIGYADAVKASLLSDCSARQVAKDSDNPSEWTGGIFLCVKD